VKIITRKTMKKVIVFDFWGTLVDSGIRSPLKQVQQTMGIILPYGEFVGRAERAMMTTVFDNLTDAFQAVCTEFNIKSSPQLMDKLVGLWNKSWLLAKPYEETKDVLEKLKQSHKLVLISNTDQMAVNNVLTKFNLTPYFDEIILSCEMGNLKTDPEMYQYIFKKLNTTPGECIAVGDSIQTDIAAATNANVEAYLIDRRGKRDFPKKIANLKEIIAIVEN
jgi:HAD superfamily hydrolase (TIGR01549 family)